MNTFRKGSISVCLCALGAMANADLPKFWNTGEDLTSGQLDSHWTTEKIQGSTAFVGPGNGYVMNTAIFPVAGAYTHTGYTNSKWISYTPEAYCNNDDIFKFSQRFYIEPAYGGNISIPDSGQIKFTGKFSSDNASEMYLNGHLIAALPPYEPIGGYSFEARKLFDASAYLQTGWNEVSFLVGSANTMGSNVGPIEEWMGLRVEGQIEMTAVPEPATFAALGVGAIALLRRRARRV